MKTSIVVLSGALAMLGVVAPAFAQEHAHHAPAPAAAIEAPAQRYATDAPLRAHMGEIRIAVGALEHAEHGHLDAAQVTALADGIQAHVRGIVAECKLPPDADHALHGIIAPLVGNASKLKAAPQDLSPVPGLRAALESYDLQFKD